MNYVLVSALAFPVAAVSFIRKTRTAAIAPLAAVFLFGTGFLILMSLGARRLAGRLLRVSRFQERDEFVIHRGPCECDRDFKSAVQGWCHSECQALVVGSSYHWRFLLGLIREDQPRECRPQFDCQTNETSHACRNLQAVASNQPTLCSVAVKKNFAPASRNRGLRRAGTADE